MRINFQTDARPKCMARRLKKKMTERGYDIGRCRALETTAHMYGYRNWHDLLANLDRSNMTPSDELVGSDVVAGRRAQYVGALVEIGVSQTDAEGIVEEIGPTRKNREIQEAARGEWEGQPTGLPEFIVLDNATACDLVRTWKVRAAASSLQFIKVNSSRGVRRDKA